MNTHSVSNDSNFLSMISTMLKLAHLTNEEHLNCSGHNLNDLNLYWSTWSTSIIKIYIDIKKWMGNSYRLFNAAKFGVLGYKISII